MIREEENAELQRQNAMYYTNAAPVHQGTISSKCTSSGCPNNAVCAKYKNNGGQCNGDNRCYYYNDVCMDKNDYKVKKTYGGGNRRSKEYIKYKKEYLKLKEELNQLHK